VTTFLEFAHMGRSVLGPPREATTGTRILARRWQDVSSSASMLGPSGGDHQRPKVKAAVTPVRQLVGRPSDAQIARRAAVRGPPSAAFWRQRPMARRTGDLEMGFEPLPRGQRARPACARGGAPSGCTAAAGREARHVVARGCAMGTSTWSSPAWSQPAEILPPVAKCFDRWRR
jgi:hypothetical protein